MKFIRVTSALLYNEDNIIYVNPEYVVTVFTGKTSLANADCTHIHMNDGSTGGYTLCVKEPIEEVLKMLLKEKE